MNIKVLKFLTLISLAIIGLIIPLIIHNVYILHLLVLVFIFASYANSWNLLMGYAGQASLGQALFFGMGSYTVGLLLLHFPHYFETNMIWLTVVAGGVTALLIGVAVGAICFRLRGPYFALTTLAITEAVRLLFLYAEDFTGGGMGIVIKNPPKVSTPFFLIDFTEKTPHYYIALSISLVSIVVTYLIARSKYGLLFQAIKEDEDAANSLGVNSFRLRLLVMAISGFIAGVSGAYYAIFLGYIDPSLEPGAVFSLFQSIDAIIICLVGGVGTVVGPFIGSVIKILVGEYLRLAFGMGAGVDLIFFGFMLIFFYLYVPNGIWGSIKNMCTWRKRA